MNHLIRNLPEVLAAFEKSPVLRRMYYAAIGGLYLWGLQGLLVAVRWW